MWSKITKESVDGEVIEELDQIQGNIPDEIYIDKSMTPSPEAYYGSLPDKIRVEASLSTILKEPQVINLGKEAEEMGIFGKFLKVIRIKRLSRQKRL